MKFAVLRVRSFFRRPSILRILSLADRRLHIKRATTFGMPARSQYDWDDKKDVCHQLYVVERKCPREIADHFAALLNVPRSEVPS